MMRGTWFKQVFLIGALASALGTAAHAGPAAEERPGAGGRQSPAERAKANRLRKVIRRVFDPAKASRVLPDSYRIGQNTYVSHQEYMDLRNGCMELLKRYPPDKYFFVGLGRDPAPVIAFLQNLGEKDLAVNLPGTSNIQWANRGITDADVAPYIEGAIPKEILAGERQIVVLDVTSSGKTPAVFGPYLDRYLAAHGNNKTSVKLAFSWINVMQGGYAGQLTDWIDTTPWTDFSQYYGGKYENGVGEHERTEMQRGGRPPTATRPEYDQFRKALAERMEQDQGLDDFVAKLNPHARIKASRPPPPPKPWYPRIRIAIRPEAGGPPEGPAFKLKNPRYEELQKKIEKAQAKIDAAGEGADKKAEARLAELQERPAEPQSYSYLDKTEYEQLRDGALALMSAGQGTADKKFFVGVGRSSTAMVAFLENLGDGVGTYLPLDGLHKYATSGGPETLDATSKQRIFELFDKFLPAEVLNGQRTVMLFQQSETGTSLPFAEALLKEYFQARNSQTQVDVVALATAAPETGVPWLNVKGWAEMEQLNSGKYLDVAPYDFYRPDRVKEADDDVLDANRKPKPRSKAYGQFKTAMAKRMKADAKIAQALTGLFPPHPESSK